MAKYGLQNFTLAILEYCNILKLDEREQFWIDLLLPKYNILKFVKSSKGYKHTLESIDKMKGPRPHFKPSLANLAKIALANKNHIYDQKSRDAISIRVGTKVYVYDLYGKLIKTYNSILKLKKDYDIKLHHKTLYKRISQGQLFKGHRFSLVPLNEELLFKTLVPILDSKNKNKTIKLININKPELSATLPSLIKAAEYVKLCDGISDRGTMRNCMNKDKIYHGTWKIIET